MERISSPTATARLRLARARRRLREKIDQFCAPIATAQFIF